MDRESLMVEDKEPELRGVGEGVWSTPRALPLGRDVLTGI